MPKRRLRDPIDYVNWNLLTRDLHIDEGTDHERALRVVLRNQFTDAVEKVLGISVFDTFNPEPPKDDDDLFDDLTDEVDEEEEPEKLPPVAPAIKEQADKKQPVRILQVPPPAKRKGTQGMTPIHRAFYLRPDDGPMEVLDFDEELTAALTETEEFPINCGCYHPKAQTWVCYSSAHIETFKFHKPMEQRGAAALLKSANHKLKKGIELPPRPFDGLPRSHSTAEKEAYSRIPLMKSGVPDMANYPVDGDLDAEAYLDARIWQPWVNVLKPGPFHRVTLFRWRSSTVWAIRDPYHLVVHTIPDEE